MPSVADANSSRNTDVSTYSALFRRVKEALLDGQRRIEEERVRTYWETGRLIRDHILRNKDRARYGAEVVARLADDLGFHKRLLYYCLRFVEKYPDLKIVNARSQFTWSHYRELISIPDDRTRSRLEGLAGKNAWSALELAARIKAARPLNDPETSSTPGVEEVVPLRGELYTYQIVKRKVLGAGLGELVIDLGFSTTHNVPSRLLSKFYPGDIVASSLQKDGYFFDKSERTPKDLYTYKALVEKVVDGDTLKVHVDLGFDVWTRQTLRLRGIDAPEVGTRAGDEAKAFVQSILKEADEIVIRSSRSDKYDRYLADVFCSGAGFPPAAGRYAVFLNDLLLKKGLAVRM